MGWSIAAVIPMHKLTINHATSRRVK